MRYVNVNDDLIHVGYRWLAVYGRPHDGHQVWCFGPRLPSFIGEDCPIAKPEKLYVPNMKSQYKQLDPKIEKTRMKIKKRSKVVAGNEHISCTNLDV